MRSSAEPSHRPAFAWLAVAALLAAGTLVVQVAAGDAGDRLAGPLAKLPNRS